jgi:hypothetical protein
MRAFFIAAMLMLTASRAAGGTLLHEQFVSDPITGGRASVTSGDANRFEWDATGMLASYDTSLPTAKLAWPLATPLDATTSFRVEVEATLKSEKFFASPNHFAQIAFGLVNSATTGNDRAGGDGGNAFDVVSLDYFPNVSPFFGGPSLGPTAIGSDNGSGFFSQIQFPFHLEGGLDDEGPLPIDAPLRFQLDYSAEDFTLTVRATHDGVALPWNANQPEIEPGGFDGDPTTIQLLLDPGTSFALDQFALLLWEDTFLAAGAGPSVRADWLFSEIRVSTPNEGLPGDTNDDGRVDLEDLNNVRNHFGQQPHGIPGDAHPQDGVIDLNDLNLVRNHFGGGPASVPEPASVALALAVGIGGATYHGGKRIARR